MVIPGQVIISLPVATNLKIPYQLAGFSRTLGSCLSFLQLKPLQNHGISDASLLSHHWDLGTDIYLKNRFKWTPKTFASSLTSKSDSVRTCWLWFI